MIHDETIRGCGQPAGRQGLPLQKQLYSIKEFGAVYGLGTTSVYALLKAGALRAVKVGGLTKIRREDAEEWASSLKLRSN
jgi:excisionase family DNA binding protein